MIICYGSYTVVLPLLILSSLQLYTAESKLGRSLPLCGESRLCQSDLCLPSGVAAFLRVAPLSLQPEELRHCVSWGSLLYELAAELNLDPISKYLDLHLSPDYNLSRECELNLRTNEGSPPGNLQSHY